MKNEKRSIIILKENSVPIELNNYLNRHQVNLNIE